MKKIITIFISFMFVSSVHAATIEEQLTEFKGKLNELEEEVTSLSNNHLNKTYPIGSIYITTTYSTVSAVANALEGTWEVYGSGKTLMGVNSGDANFNTVNKTGGVSETFLTTSHLPSHTHSIPSLSGTTDNIGAHTHTRGTMNITGRGNFRDINYETHNLFLDGSGAISASREYWPDGPHGSTKIINTSTTYLNILNFDASRSWTGSTSSNGNHSHNIATSASTSGPSGSGTSFTNLQPYITVYMYKRIG